jgi:lipoprotein-anchoring transpeptidase ErfK/SrfK
VVIEFARARIRGGRGIPRSLAEPRRVAFAASIALALSVAACDGRKDAGRDDEAASTPAPDAPAPGAPDSAGVSDPAHAGVDSTAIEAPPTYRALPIASTRAWLRYAARLGAERLAIVLKVNRIDRDHVLLGDTLALPWPLADTSFVLQRPPDEIELELAALPRSVPALDSVPKLLAISRRVQAFGAYERGRLVRWGPTSTGKRSSPTPDGLFHVNWQAKSTISTEDSSWVLPWYLNFDNRRGLSIHQYALPGFPASHACVRLLEPDAEWLYGWAEQWVVSADSRTVVAPGTPILIFGEWAFGRRPPWRRLADDPLAATVSVAEIDSALAPHLAAILEGGRTRRALAPRG